MSEVRGSVEGIDIPAVVAARVPQSFFFAENVVGRPMLRDSLANQRL